MFTSRQIPDLPGLAGAKNNVNAALGYVPNICLFKGGTKLRNKIKKISTKYKMKGKKNTKSIKRRIKSRFIKKTRKTRTRRSLKGGYSQYQNNLPMTPSYSVGGILKASDLGLANPPPFKVLSNCTNCVDNYNHYTNKGFPSRGH
jgi:hypothetical protein